MKKCLDCEARIAKRRAYAKQRYWSRTPEKKEKVKIYYRQYYHDHKTPELLEKRAANHRKYYANLSPERKKARVDSRKKREDYIKEGLEPLRKNPGWRPWTEKDPGHLGIIERREKGFVPLEELAEHFAKKK